MGWPVPGRDTDPWFAGFASMVAAMDASAFASREDNELIIAGCAEYTFDAGTDSLSWVGTQEFVSSFSGYAMQLAVGNVSVREGETVYVNLSRAPTADAPTIAGVASIVPNHDDAFALCVRREDALYFRNGVRILDGHTVNILKAAEDEYTILNMGDRQTHSDTARLSVGAIAFNPADHAKDGMEMSVIFRVSAASGNDGVLGYVTLRNYTDGEDVLTLDVLSSLVTAIEAEATLGTGAGEIDNVERLYEVLLHLDAAPGPQDGVELYSAEIRVENAVGPCSP
jgi:hypothetical protein